MKSTKISAVSVALLGGLLGFSVSASAQSTWNLGAYNSTGAPCPDPVSGVATCTIGSVTATMTAYGNTGSTGAVYVKGNLGSNDPNGFGAFTGTSETSWNGQHAFDNVSTSCGTQSAQTSTNCGGTNEVMLIGFGSAKVNLSSLAIGYWLTDADISVLRWDGAGDATLPTNGTAGLPTNGAAVNGWSLVSSKDVLNDGVKIDNPNTANVVSDEARRFDVSSGFGYDASKSDNKVSSWWLISTYYGSVAGSGANSNLDATNNDRFKLLNFVTSTCAGTPSGGNGGNGGTCSSFRGSVPEPGSLALVGACLLGWFVSRRSKPLLNIAAVAG